MCRITIITGNFGSGKTEIAINMALKLSKRQSVTLVDLDIVNPYFRSSMHTEMLTENGIKVIYPNFARTIVDVPSLPPEVDSVFVDTARKVIFDVGGDPTGAIALGRYNPRFRQESYEMLYVVNLRRPLSSNAQQIMDMLKDIEYASRLGVTGLVNNTNLAAETTLQELIDGQNVLKEVSKELNIPIQYTTGKKQVLDAFMASGDMQGQPLELDIFMRKDWMDLKI